LPVFGIMNSCKCKKLMKRLLITSLIALGLLYSGPAVAATALSDTELAGIRGGEDMPLDGQSLPQEQQQPNQNGTGYTPLRQPQGIDGMDLAPELFAILQSRIDAERERKLLLHGTTQQGAIALNLDNVLSSDSVSSSNIFEGSSISLDDLTTGIEINQLNDLSQLHRTQGNLSSSIAGHRYEKIVESSSGAESYDYHVYSNIYRERRSSLLRTDSGYNHVQVGSRFTSLDDIGTFDPPKKLIEAEEYGPWFDFPKFVLIIPFPGYTGTTLTGIGLNLDSIKAQGNNLVVWTSLTLPRFDFGTIDNWSPIPDIPLLKIGGSSIPLPFAIPGLAPRIDELNLGTGFALKGSGDVTTYPGILLVNGGVALDVTARAKLVLDLSGVPVLGAVLDVLNIKPLRIDLKTQIANEDISFELLNEDFDIDPIDDDDIDPIDIVTDETLDLDNDIIEIYDAVDVTESSFTESYEHTVFIGGRMTGAEGELLALSEGTLAVDNNSTVSLADGAQRNMRVLHGVNAVSSIAANALNIGRSPSFTVGPSATPRTSIQQQNRFNQQR
jgi:hypothetical protein